MKNLNNINNIKRYLDKILMDSKDEIKYIKNINDLNIFKSKYIGKNSFIFKLINNFHKIKTKNKSIIGNLLNKIKNNIKILYLNNKNEILNNIKNKIKFNFDITAPYNSEIGGLHPISFVIEKIKKKFIELGFDILFGNEIENFYNNFDLLNIPINHPSRSKKDTFYIKENLILRTQTTSIQSRIINKKSFPIKIISYGKVYRRDKDRTHTPMFHQIDGVYIDKNINFSNLKYILINFINYFFEKKNLNLRFRPSYFPFTEPSIEIDIMIKKKWIEVIGAGMINSKILKNLNINNNIYSGFAFGIGVERLIMLKYNIKDLKCLFENNLKFLNQFKYI